MRASLAACMVVLCAGIIPMSCTDDPSIGEGEPRSFAMTRCDDQAGCPDGFTCQPVYCDAACIPDGDGGCEPCNEGHHGQCMPDPVLECGQDLTCDANEVCSMSCTGSCDDATGQCSDVVCTSECIPAWCDANADCGPNQECLMYCLDGACGADGTCTESDCIGVCAEIPQPVECDADANCPAGHTCAPVFCTMECSPDGEGGCLPCNDGSAGQCIPDPIYGCGDDAACPPGTICRITSTGGCDAFSPDCEDFTQGECVPADGCLSDEECGPDLVCELVCPYMGEDGVPLPGDPDEPPPEPTDPAVDPTSQDCFGQCMPAPVPPDTCNADAECAAGFMCEPIFCEMSCDASLPDGGCGPCNDDMFGICVPIPNEGCQSNDDCDGQDCQVVCTGTCDPFGGCFEECYGICVDLGGCQDDMECGEGYSCLELCPPVSSDDPDRIDDACFGQCVFDDIPCSDADDCPDGQLCEAIYCTAECLPDPDGSTECMPCNDGFAGLCRPAPSSGCTADSDCSDTEVCQVSCSGSCSSDGGCTEECTGVCVSTDDIPPDCYCSEEYAPVCGDDGITYSNACHALCAGAQIAYEGECQ